MTTYAVRFEGTIASQVDSDWAPDPDVKAWMELEHDKGNYINVVSVLAGTTMGLKQLKMWLSDNAIPYDDAWSGFCLPEHDVYIDNNAKAIR